MNLSKALDLLQAYEPKKLCAQSYSENGLCCALGALIPSLRTLKGLAQKTSFFMVLEGYIINEDEEGEKIHIKLDETTHKKIKEEAKEVGLDNDWGQRLQNNNDDTTLTPEQRYQVVIDYLRANL